MKKLFLVLMACAFMFSLVGCGGGGGDDAPAEVGDNGAFLKENYSEIYNICVNDMSNAKGVASLVNTSDLDKAATDKRVDNFLKYVSTNISLNNGRKYNDLEKRLKDLLNRYEISVYTVSPFKTLNEEKGLTVVEERTDCRCKLTKKPGAEGSITSADHNVKKTYVWKQEDGQWKITSGLDYFWSDDFDPQN